MDLWHTTDVRPRADVAGIPLHYAPTALPATKNEGSSTPVSKVDAGGFSRFRKGRSLRRPAACWTKAVGRRFAGSAVSWCLVGAKLRRASVPLFYESSANAQPPPHRQPRLPRNRPDRCGRGRCRRCGGRSPGSSPRGSRSSRSTRRAPPGTRPRRGPGRDHGMGNRRADGRTRGVRGLQVEPPQLSRQVRIGSRRRDG